MFTLFEHFRRMMKPAPGHICHVKQTVDAADVNEGAVLGKILDRAVDYITDVDIRQRLGFLFVYDLVGYDLA